MLVAQRVGESVSSYDWSVEPFCQDRRETLVIDPRWLVVQVVDHYGATVKEWSVPFSELPPNMNAALSLQLRVTIEHRDPPRLIMQQPLSAWPPYE